MTAAHAPSNVTPITSRGSKKAKLSPAEVVKRYADEHFTARGLCIRYSTSKSVLFDPGPNKTMSTDLILDQFAGWLHENNLEVDVENYGTFLATLIPRVRSHMEQVYGSGFRPVADRFYVDSNGAPLANTYKPFDPPAPADPTAPPMLLELFDRIAPVPAEQKLLIEWTAAIFQRPLERPIWGVILTGDSKCGKSSLVSVIKAGIGESNVNDSVEYTGLWKEFSTVWADYSLIAVEDQVAPRDADTRMKQAMSLPSKMFSMKNEQEQVRRDMHSRIAITSNLRRPLRLDPSVRRWLAVQFIEHRVSVEDSVDFFNRFYEWLAKPEAPAQIVHFFRNVKIEVYNPNLCPVTPTLQEMIGQSTSALDRVIADYVSPGHAFLEQELREHIEIEMQELPKRELADRISDALSIHGYKKVRREIAGVAKRQWVWVKEKGKRSDGFSSQDEARMAEVLGVKKS